MSFYASLFASLYLFIFISAVFSFFSFLFYVFNRTLHHISAVQFSVLLWWAVRFSVSPFAQSANTTSVVFGRNNVSVFHSPRFVAVSVVSLCQNFRF